MKNEQIIVSRFQTQKINHQGKRNINYTVLSLYTVYLCGITILSSINMYNYKRIIRDTKSEPTVFLNYIARGNSICTFYSWNLPWALYCLSPTELYQPPFELKYAGLQEAVWKLKGDTF